MRRSLSHKMDKLKTPFQLPTTIKLCKKMKKEAIIELRQAERDEFRTHKLRLEFQFELQAKYEEKGNKKSAEVIKQMREKETVKRAWAKCATAMGKNHNGGIKNLQAPKEETSDPKTCKGWVFIEDPNEIERKLQDHFKTHFAQADETDFRQPPLINDTNFSANTETANKIMRGEHDYHQENL